MRFSADGQAFASLEGIPGAAEDFTIACWGMLLVDRDTRQVVWGLDSGAAQDAIILSTALDGTTLQIVTVDTTPSVLAVDIAVLTLGEWFHAVIRRRDGNVIEWSFLRQGDTTPTLGQSIDDRWSLVTNPTTFRINESFSPNTWWNGRINAVKVWNAFLEYDTGELHVEPHFWHAKRYDNLLHSHPLMNTDNAAVDYSGNGNTLAGGVGATTEDGPPIMLAPGRRMVPQALSIPANIAASIAMSLGVAGELRGTADLNAAVGLSLTVQGQPSGVGHLEAATTILLTPVADLRARGVLQATPVMSFTGTAALEGRGSLQAQVPLALALTSNLDGLGRLEAAGALVFELVPDLQGATDNALAANVQMAITASASLKAVGSLDAIAQLVLANAVDLTGRGDLSADAVFILDVAAGLSGLGGLDALAELTLTVVPVVGGDAALFAQPTITFGGGANVRAQGRLEGAVALALDVAGRTSFEGALEASVDNTFFLSPDLSASAEVEAVIDLIMEVLGNLDEAGPEDFIRIAIIGRTIRTIAITARKASITITGHSQDE